MARNAAEKAKQGGRALRREDWLIAALRTLKKHGYAAVEITRLARDLKVSRGSFYWHFNKREDLLDGLIAAWQDRNSGVMIEAIEGATTLTNGIMRLFTAWVAGERFDFALDQAMRDWARHSDDVLAAVRKEDDLRIAAIQGFFERFGYEHDEAFIRARIIYFTQVSYYALGVAEPIGKRFSYTTHYFKAFTGQEIDHKEFEAFREGFLAVPNDPTS